MKPEDRERYRPLLEMSAEEFAEWMEYSRQKAEATSAKVDKQIRTLMIVLFIVIVVLVILRAIV